MEIEYHLQFDKTLENDRVTVKIVKCKQFDVFWVNDVRVYVCLHWLSQMAKGN